MNTTTDMQKSEAAAKPVIFGANQGESLRPFGLEMYVTLTQATTGGKMSALFARHQPGQGPLQHIHHHQEEFMVIVEGTYEFRIEDQEPVRLGPGSVVFVPRGFWHGFKNVGDTPAVMIDCTLPSGQDEYFRRCSALNQSGFTSDDIKRISAEHDTFYRGS